MRLINKIGIATATAALMASLGALPATAQPTQPGIKVASNADEIHTGLGLTEGLPFSIIGYGEITYGADWAPSIGAYTTFLVHPDGARHFAGDNITQQPKYDPAALAPEAPAGSLIYRIGESPWQTVPTLEALPVPTTNGELTLAVNDVPDQPDNNTGAFNVHVERAWIEPTN